MACKDLGTVISGAERIPRDSGTSDNTGLSGLCHPRVFTNDLLFGALPWLNPPLVRPHGDRLISDGWGFNVCMGAAAEPNRDMLLLQGSLGACY